MKFFGLFFVFLFSLVVTSISLLPVRVATEIFNLNRIGFVYETAYGTVWNGGMTGVRYMNQPIGQVDLRIEAGTFLTFSPEINLLVRGQVGTAKGNIVASLSGVEVENFNADINMQELRYLEPTLRQIPSKLSLGIKSFKFGFNGKCMGGTSSIDTDILTAAGRQWQWEGPAMEGQITCSDGALKVQLNESFGSDKISVSAAPAEGGVLAKAQVRTNHEGLARALSALGFIFDGGVYRYEKIRTNDISRS